jgi:hypothetical protein
MALMICVIEAHALGRKGHATLLMRVAHLSFSFYLFLSNFRLIFHIILMTLGLLAYWRHPLAVYNIGSISGARRGSLICLGFFEPLASCVALSTPASFLLCKYLLKKFRSQYECDNTFFLNVLLLSSGISLPGYLGSLNS